MGWFEVARKGTIFLDEIAEMKPSTQAKLLRVLEDRRFHRLGGSEIIEADVRIIAATNRDLPEEIDEGRFREDLFYRLNVFPIELPPLRERLEDLDELCAHFLRRTGARAPTIEPEAMDALFQYEWPGNLRELRNVIERAVILAGDRPIGLEEIHIPARRTRETASIPMGLPASASAAEDLSLSDQEEQMIRQALEKSGGNKSKAARLLGITRRALYGRLDKYGI
jgi:transcriptional regulator with PAS, ATPase and Fis domain